MTMASVDLPDQSRALSRSTADGRHGAIGAGDNGQHLDQRSAPEYTSLIRATRADPIIAAVGPSATIQGQIPSWMKEVPMVTDSCRSPNRSPRPRSDDELSGLCNLETSPYKSLTANGKGKGHAKN
jgi:hypothetical protein